MLPRARQQPKLVLAFRLERIQGWPGLVAVVAMLFQREDQSAGNSPDGSLGRQHASSLQADGSNCRVLADAAWQPAPSPNGGSVAFVAAERPSLMVLSPSTRPSARW
jgi:hypothetical protein